MSKDSLNLIELSQQLLIAAKYKLTTTSIVYNLTLVSNEQLKNQLQTDIEKKCFWLNIYNAFTQIILGNNSSKYQNKRAFFSLPQINIAQQLLSLDDIEHGLLRRSKAKWSLGFFTKSNTSNFEKEHRVDVLDFRIHFALNCGATSCPPILFYSPNTLNAQLDVATKSYLKQEALYNDSANTVTLPALMQWFKGDFGNKTCVLELLKSLEILPEDVTPDILYSNYNWNLQLENYLQEQSISLENSTHHFC